MACSPGATACILAGSMLMQPRSRLAHSNACEAARHTWLLSAGSLQPPDPAAHSYPCHSRNLRSQHRPACDRAGTPADCPQVSQAAGWSAARGTAARAPRAESGGTRAPLRLCAGGWVARSSGHLPRLAGQHNPAERGTNIVQQLGMAHRVHRVSSAGSLWCLPSGCTSCSGRRSSTASSRSSGRRSNGERVCAIGPAAGAVTSGGLSGGGRCDCW